MTAITIKYDYESKSYAAIEMINHKKVNVHSKYKYTKILQISFVKSEDGTLVLESHHFMLPR